MLYYHGSHAILGASNRLSLLKVGADLLVFGLFPPSHRQKLLSFAHTYVRHTKKVADAKKKRIGR